MSAIDELRPLSGVVENVEGFSHKQKDHSISALQVFISQLEAKGYCCEYVFMDNLSFFKSARRRRVIL